MQGKNKKNIYVFGNSGVAEVQNDQTVKRFFF